VIAVFNLSIVTFLVLLGLSMVSPILPHYAESFQISYTLVGFVISSFAITRMLLDMPAGFLSRKYDKKVIMIAGLILIVISSLLAGNAYSYEVLIIARMIEGAGSALYVTSATVFIAQIVDTERRGQLMSMYTGMLLLGTIFGPTFGGIIAATYDIRAPFFAYAIVVSFGIPTTLILPKIDNSETTTSFETKTSPLRDVWSILTYPSFLIATLATFTLFFLRTGVRSTLVPLFADNNIGLDSGEIGLILTLAGITTAVTMVPMGGVSDRIGRKIPLIICLLMSAGVTIWIPFSTNMLELSICMAVYGLVIGLSGPLAAFVTDVSPEDKIEVSMGLYRMISDIGYIIGPSLLGYLADISAANSSGDNISGQIGLLPFVVASTLMIIAGLTLFKAHDPIRNGNIQASIQEQENLEPVFQLDD
jgi:DHA1 family multidrug resistance protein-like MFS transporter